MARGSVVTVAVGAQLIWSPSETICLRQSSICEKNRPGLIEVCLSAVPVLTAGSLVLYEPEPWLSELSGLSGTIGPLSGHYRATIGSVVVQLLSGLSGTIGALSGPFR